MFAVLTRPVQRRVTYHAVRCMSRNPPQPHPPSSASGVDKGNLEQAPTEPGSHSVGKEPKINPSELPSLDFLPAEAKKEEPKVTGAKSAKDPLTTGEKKRRYVLRLTWGMMLLGFGAYTVYMGREWDKDELDMLEKRRTRIEDVPSTRWGRTTRRFGDFFNFFSEPVWPELLPPPMPPPHGKPYTLVVSLDDLLITSTWDRQHGWRTAKRPGVDYFLAYISQFYEVVVFTTQPSYTAAPVLDKLDRYGFFISHRLFREHTRSVKGQPVKDLSYLNRDLSKVVCLDTVLDHYNTHLENAIIVSKWKGDPSDSGLIAMIPFLESIAIYKPLDARPILDAYQGKNIPIEYAKKETEAKTKHIEEWKKSHKGVSSSFFSRLLGFSSASSTDGPPPTYLEQKRKEAQMHYLEEQKYLETHKDELERLIKQQEEAMAGQVPTNLWAALDQFSKRDDPNQASQTGQGTPTSQGSDVKVTAAPSPSSTAQQQQER